MTCLRWRRKRREELGVMCRALARRIKPDGRFVTLTTNPGLYSFKDPDYRKYGFEIRLEDHVHEGASIVWTINRNDLSLEVENYYLPNEAYETALKEAGFQDVAFHQLSVSPDAGSDEDGYWAGFLKIPPAVMIDCVKG